ncbi:cytochrome c, class I [Oceaniovalibus guishaninsula JLT2003]|uniref:Cytochrome c, class I n=1 Tax=Oceaniovalibus guishaninsula JLT2003 TaxID=1231392 RepID=K2HBV4_9RHOB|nr:c-type cytochrome [Oceaniovalibus guishaninsula]EKE44092.1 cytochrome c, class I [Oceaniovalibus guishaninsula JLT2003]
MKPIWIAAILPIVAGAGAVLLWPDTAATSAGAIPWRDADAVARGGQVYAAECAVCHGADLEGQANWREPGPDGRYPAPPHDETGHTWHHPDTVLIDIVRRGTAAVVGQGYESDMPGYAGVLSQNDIRAVLAYIKARWPADIVARHDAMSR